MAKITTAIDKMLYPKVTSALSSRKNEYKKCISRFIEERHDQLYDPLPCDRIFFKDNERIDLYNALKIDESTITNAIHNTYYYPISNFNPRSAKDECTVLMLCIVRYFTLKRMEKELELALIHLSFSGKLYPSIHYGLWPTVSPDQYRHVMEYCVNNEMSNKFEIKAEGSVIGCIRNIAKLWCTSYQARFKRFTDEDVTYLIQQLHGRIKSVMKNIASVYYRVYEDKDKYMAYAAENLEDGDDFRMIDNDSLLAERIAEKSMSSIVTKDVDYKICHAAADKNVKVEEVKGIIQSIVQDPKEQTKIKELIALQVSTYMEQSKNKDIHDIQFLSFNCARKPNTKDKNILRQNEIVDSWLTSKSEKFNRRKHRPETRISYERCVYTYFAMVTYQSNK